jgi:cell division protein FtsQ
MFITMWVIIAGGMSVLLAAAMRKQKSDRCRNYTIVLKGKEDNYFIDEKGVNDLLLSVCKGKIKDQPLASFDLRSLEQALEKNSWINDAELYFDNQETLHVTVTEKTPIARIFTVNGNTYYIDSLANRIPLSDKVSARVPVFTDFPVNKIVSSRDSLLLHDVASIAQFIYRDAFWMAEVSQIDITPERNFEMIPVIGDHVVRLGNAENIQEKFRRLFIFYDQVLSKSGFNIYKTIDVQYAGQVVGLKQTGAAIRIDSIQLRKNVDKLLKQSKEGALPEVMLKPLPTKPLEADQPDSLLIPDKKDLDPNPVKTNPVSNDKTVKGKPQVIKTTSSPKAVMPNKNEQ